MFRLLSGVKWQKKRTINEVTLPPNCISVPGILAVDS